MEMTPNHKRLILQIWSSLLEAYREGKGTRIDLSEVQLKPLRAMLYGLAQKSGVQRHISVNNRTGHVYIWLSPAPLPRRGRSGKRKSC